MHAILRIHNFKNKRVIIQCRARIRKGPWDNESNYYATVKEIPSRKAQSAFSTIIKFKIAAKKIKLES
jgi:P pilus assembly chaperone PapD